MISYAIVTLLLITIASSIMGFRVETYRALLSCVVIAAASYIAALVVFYLK